MKNLKKQKMNQTNTVKKIAPIALLAAFSVCTPWASEGTSFEQQNDLQAKWDAFKARNGIEFFGSVDGEFFSSRLNPKDASSDPRYEQEEKTQATRLDAGFLFRPYQAVSAKFLFRFYQDWQTYFLDRMTPISARWISIDGRHGDAKMGLSYNIGDFKQKYSPLTLWAPEMNFVYEPKIFERMRTEAMEEYFLGDNLRPLQGFNFNSALEINQGTEIRLDGYLTRIARTEYLDKTYKQGLGEYAGIYNNKDSTIVPAGNYGLGGFDHERYSYGANFDLLVAKNWLLGANYINNFAVQGTYHSNTIDNPDTNLAAHTTTWNGKSVQPLKNSTIIGAHVNGDVGAYFGDSSVVAELLVDYAMSTLKSENPIPGADDSWNALKAANPDDYKDVKGNAMLLSVNAGINQGAKGLKALLNLRYLKNDSGFYNPMAQSQTFIPERIMNVENDGQSNRLYSTFDALYHSVYKYSPIDNSNTQQAPYSKNSYTNSIREEEVAYDPYLQSALPSGLASANRTGLDLDIDFGWTKAIGAKVVYANLKEVKAIGQTPVKAFTQVGGGAKVDIGAFISETTNPIEISGSVVNGTSDIDQDLKLKTQLLNAGANVFFTKKLGLIAGYQTLNGDWTDSDAAATIKSVKVKQSQVMGGVVYQLSNGAYAQFALGQAKTTTDQPVTVGLEEIKDHEGRNSGTVIDGTKVDFTQFLTQVKIHAAF